MFDTISSKLYDVVRKINGTGVISEKNIEDALREIRMSLLEADVNYKVVKNFIESVKEKAVGQDVLKSVSPGQQFIKIVSDELTAYLGDKNTGLNIANKPLIIMLTGLQGSGKTTTAAKLAYYLKTEKKFDRILLIAADTYRPAAREQLEKLSKSIGTAFYTEAHNDPVKIAVNGYKKLETEVYDAVIVDTAGRLHIDEAMLEELKKMRAAIRFTDILLVADSMLGQESVNVAKNFNDAVGITGIILTKIDGDARGGAALSMKQTVNVPIRFMGTGEKIERLEVFHPERIASRILGMGDVVSLVEKVGMNITAEDAKKAEAKLRKSTFTLEDFLEQMQQMKKMGPMEDIIKMIPGANKMGLSNMSVDEKEIKHTEAIILSMTKRERNHPEIIDMSRKARIAKGSGVKPEKVTRLLKQFLQMKKMMKSMGKRRHGMGSGFPGMPGMPQF
jgi:signal recognition particle subunit SRP54